jgi:hypothetical protein
MASAAIVAASAMPWLLRASLVSALVSGGWFWLRRAVWLRGSRALRAVEWTAAGQFLVEAGDERRRLAATPAAGWQRFGVRLWILRFDTADGPLVAVIDSTTHRADAIRRLGRCLETSRRGELLPSRPKV